MSNIPTEHTLEERLAQKPFRREDLKWEFRENNKVTLHVEQTGRVDRFMQKVFKSPKYMNVKLEEIGSFVWPMMDGEHNVEEIGRAMSEKFGESVEPLYPRLVQYITALVNRGFAAWGVREEDR